jgi:hypothetical protein
METSNSVSCWWNEALQVIDAIEVVEVIEAAEVPDAREITQYAMWKLSFSVRRYKWAKNVEKNWKFLYISTFKLFFAPFLYEAVENRDVTFDQIEGSYVKFPLFRIPKSPSNQIWLEYFYQSEQIEM